jgi:hypothetical protein
MQVNNLPFADKFLEHNGSPVKKSGPVVEVKRHNSDIAGHLNSKVARLQVHIRPLCPAASDLFENLPEGAFKFRAAIGAAGKSPRVKYCCVVSERGAETLPIEVVEGLTAVSVEDSSSACAKVVVLIRTANVSAKNLLIRTAVYRHRTMSRVDYDLIHL